MGRQRLAPSFRPAASVLKQALQESGRPFKSDVLTDEAAAPELYGNCSAGVAAIHSCLVNQPGDDILDLAAVAPDLFEPPELREILRDALREQADPARVPIKPRSM